MSKIIPVFTALQLNELDARQDLPILTHGMGPNAILLTPIGAIDAQAPWTLLHEAAHTRMQLKEQLSGGASALPHGPLDVIIESLGILKGLAMGGTYEKTIRNLHNDPGFIIAGYVIVPTPSATKLDVKTMMDLAREVAEISVAAIKKKTPNQQGIELSPGPHQPLGLFLFDWDQDDGWRNMLNQASAIHDAHLLRASLPVKKTRRDKKNSSL